MAAGGVPHVNGGCDKDNAASRRVMQRVGMSVAYLEITRFPRGTLRGLLIDAYAFDARIRDACGQSWREFDDFFFDNPSVADSCGFITASEGEPIGFVSWDPRKAPASVEIGHNCVAAAHKGNGYGKAQLREAIRRILPRGPETIIVSTNEALIPAQRMYEGVGFRRVAVREPANGTDFLGDMIHYEYSP